MTQCQKHLNPKNKKSNHQIMQTVRQEHAVQTLVEVIFKNQTLHDCQAPHQKKSRLTSGEVDDHHLPI